MAEAAYIKDQYENEGLSLREIARRTGHSFQTVQKYAQKEDWREEDKQPNLDAEEYPVLKEYIPHINGWLEEDRKVPRKQRHTVKRIYDRLREEHGFPGSYSSVKRYVKKRREVMKQATEGYLPLAQPPGQGQVDFGQCLYKDGQGQERKGYALTVTFPQSNMGFTQLYPGQDQVCLLTGLQRVFEHIGGVPPRLRFDNLSAAVTKVQESQERELTEGFTRFMLHYRFQAEFCNPASGNEKGNVENKVGYHRRNFFVPVPTVASLDEFNAWLWEACEKDGQREHYKKKVPIVELWEEDKKSLLPLPEYPFPVFRYETLRVDKCGFVKVETNRYGLAPELAGKLVQAKIFLERVEFTYDHQLVGQYPRRYGRHEEVTDWTHYVGALLRKPGAVEHTKFFEQMPQQWQTLLAQVQGKERRAALRLLEEMVEDGHGSTCEEALTMAAQAGRRDVASIRQCYYMLTKQEPRPDPLQLDGVSAPELNYDPDISVYDTLL